MFGQQQGRQRVGFHVFKKGSWVGAADRLFRLNTIAVKEADGVDDAVEFLKFFKGVVDSFVVGEIQLHGVYFGRCGLWWSGMPGERDRLNLIILSKTVGQRDTNRAAGD